MGRSQVAGQGPYTVARPDDHLHSTGREGIGGGGRGRGGIGGGTEAEDGKGIGR